MELKYCCLTWHNTGSCNNSTSADKLVALRSPTGWSQEQFDQYQQLRPRASPGTEGRYCDSSSTNGELPDSVNLRISSVIRIEQYFGPHMLQKWALLNVSCGKVSS